MKTLRSVRARSTNVKRVLKEVEMFKRVPTTVWRCNAVQSSDSSPLYDYMMPVCANEASQIGQRVCSPCTYIYVILCSKRVGEIYSHTRTSATPG